MLAVEQALRDDLNALNRRAANLARHAEYDRSIREIHEEASPLLLEMTGNATRLAEVVTAIALSRIKDEPSVQGCREAKILIADLDQQLATIQGLVDRLVVLVEQRANLNTQATDRDELATSVEAIADHIDTIEAALERDRLLVNQMCPDADRELS